MITNKIQIFLQKYSLIKQSVNLNIRSAWNFVDRNKLILAGLIWAAVSYNMGTVTFTTGNIIRDFAVSRFYVGLLVSITLIGWFFGSLIFGYLSDIYGRRKIVIFGTIIQIISTGLMGIFPSYISFIILRFLAGMGFGITLPVLSAWVSEKSPIEKRGRNVVLLDSFWTYGWIIASFFAYIYLPSLGDRWYFYYYLSFLWLLVLPAFRWIEDVSVSLRKGKLRDVLKYTHTYPLWLLWFSMAFSYYGIFVWLPRIFSTVYPLQSYEFIFITYIFQIPGYFTAAYLVEKIGRKPVLIIFIVLTAVFAYLFIFEGIWIISASLISFFDLGAWGAMYAFTPELYPSNLKGSGSGLASSAGRVGGIIGPLIPGFLSWFNAFSLFIFLLLIASISVLFIPETKGASIF